jgi:uncharacterized protein
MPLLIDKLEISDPEIKREMDQMRPQYIDTFTNQSQYEREKTLFDWALENLTEQVLLREYALKNIQISETELERELLQKSEETKSDKNLRIGRLKIQRLIEQVESESPAVTQQEARQYYEKNSARFMAPERRHVKHIVIHPVRGLADTGLNPVQILKQAEKELEQGESFEDVGNKYSDCKGKGLDLGYFTRGEMVPAFEEVVFSLKKGEISKIFITEFGHHLARVYDIKISHRLSFAQVSTQIIDQLKKEKIQKSIEDFVDKLKIEANIRYVAPRIKVQSARAGFVFAKPLNSLLIKPAGPDCNIKCDYCFYLRKEKMFNAGVKRMDLDTAKHIIQQAAEQSLGGISFNWQGGEPTLIGLDFFKQIVKLQAKYGRDKFINSIQTNGLLLNGDWAEFLRENQFLVGLSIDGEKHIHDRYRKYAGGQGSWEKVVKIAELLLGRGVAVNSISVVNDYSAKFARETYFFLKGLGFMHMQFIPIVELDRERGIPAEFSVKSEAYGHFMVELLDLWKKDFHDGYPDIYIRFFENLLHKFDGQESLDCILKKECADYLVIEHNGDVYPCDFFVEKERNLGNIKSGHLLEMLNSKEQDRLGKSKMELSDKCQKCEWLSVCYGGCPKDRIADKNISYLCEGYKMIFKEWGQIFP